MRKVIMVMILFVLLSLSVVSANDCFMGNDSISYTDVDVSAINSNSLHDEFDFYSFSQDDDFVDDFIDDVPDSDAVFNDSFNLDTVQDDDLEESSININPVNLNGGIDAGIQSNPDSSDNIKYVTVLNYEQLLDAFDDLDTNHDSAVITLSGSSIYTVTQPIVFGTDQSITNVTINAMGHAITGEDTEHFLTIKYGYTLTLNNITIQNMNSASNGGAIDNNGTLNIYDSVIVNNTAYAGGAIFNEGYLYIKNSQVMYNYADFGGAIRNSGRAILFKSSFHHNEALTGNGGVIHSKGIVESYNNSIRYNSASSNGAFAYNQKYNLTIVNDTIYNNIADNGGVIFNNATVSTINASIYDNIARINGGTVYNYEDATLTIKNTNLHNNTANNGGAVYNKGNLSLIKNSIKNNQANNFGGVVYSNCFSNLTDNSIKYNSAANGSVIYNNEGNITLNNNTIYNNTATNIASVINNYGTITSYNNSYYNNTAIGAGIHVNYGLLNITDDIYMDNFADNAGVLFNNNITYINGSVFENNSGSILAGVLYNDKTLTIDYSTFTGNNVDFIIDSQTNIINHIIYGGYGGVLYNTDSTIISNSNFTDNQAKITVVNQTVSDENIKLTGIGGVIYNEGITNTLNSTYSSNYAQLMAAVVYNSGLFNATNNSFEDNSASLQAGVIMNVNKTIFTNNYIRNNTANDLGGFIYNDAEMTLTGNTIYENLAGQAAGIYATDGRSNITNNTFNNSYSPVSGSAIQVTGTDNVTLTGNVFTCNNAEVGGAVYINNSRTILENNTFTGNGLNNPVRLIPTLTGNYTTSNMTQLGACIYINGSVVEINNDTYTNNTASVHASCIYSKDSLILINNTVFEDNNANTGVGGAVYSDESTLFIYNSQLSNNSALVGGAITQAGSNDLTIRNTILTDNSADKCGGAVYVINSPVVLVNNTITGNTADNASSLCVLSSPIGSIKDNLFDNSQCDTSSVYLFESNLLVESNTFIGDNIDLNDMGLYSIESNYWGSNQPDFNTRTGNNIPNSITTVNSTDEYNIYLTVPGTVKNNRTIAVNISIQNQYNENVTEGSVRLEINDTLESVIACTDGFFAYNLTITEGSVGSIVIKATYIDSNDVETDLNIFKTVKIISPEEIYIVSIPQRAIPNEKIQFVVKILKEDNTFISNRKVRAYINNTYIGTFKVSNEKYLLNYTVPSSYHGLYNIKLSCRDTNLKELTSKNITFFVESNTTRVVDVDDLNIDYNLENITLPASYDIRDDGVMVDFENQGDSGNCWAFSVLDCLEYSLNKQSNITCDFSENNMKNILSTNAIFKSDRTPNTGCDIVSSVGYLVSRLGPVYEYNDPYWMYSQLSVNQNSDYNVNDVLFISNRQNTSDNMELKKAIYQYGAVVSTLHINEETTEISDIHDDEFHLPNHAVAVIGWDDNYSRYNFENIPVGDGAFIVTDSIFNDTYHVSYYDYNFAGLYTTNNNTMDGLFINNIAFPINTAKCYDNVIQNGILPYDGYATLDSQDLWINNTYNMTGEGYLTAVGIYNLNKSNYTINIYRNNHLEYTQNNTINSIGYITIALNKCIMLEKYDTLNVVVKVTSLEENVTGYMMEKAYKTYNTSRNASLVSSDGINWINLHDYPQFTDNHIHLASLKLYTNNTIHGNYQINITPTTHVYNKTDTYNIIITDNTGNPVMQTQFNMTLDNTQYTVSTDNSGLMLVNAGVLEVGRHNLEIINNDLEINYTTPITVIDDNLSEINDTIIVHLLNDTFVRGMNNKIHVLVYHDDGIGVNMGKVVIKVNGKTLKDDNGHVIYASVVHGEVIVNYTFNSSYTLGEHPVQVVYTSSMARVEEDYNISFIRKDIKIDICEVYAFYNKSLYLNASVKSIDDINVDGEQVAIKINGITTATHTVTNGTVILNQSIPYTWSPGEYNLELVIGQTSWYNSIRYKTVFTIYNDSMDYYSNLTYDYYYPLYGEYEYTDDNVVNINVINSNLMGNIKTIELNLSAPEDYTVYYSTNGQPPTTANGSFTNSSVVTLRLHPTNITQNNSYTTTIYLKSYILKYFYIHNNIVSDTYYYQANGIIIITDYISSHDYFFCMGHDTDNRTPEIYTTLNKNFDSTYNLLIMANKTGTIQYQVDNNTPQTYMPKTILTLNENSTVHITLTTTSGETVSKSIRIVDINKPLIIVKPITTYTDGYQNVSFVCDDEDAVIYYTRDGSDPLNTTNLRQANSTSILTLNNLTQLKYYVINQYNQSSPVYTYRTPRNEVSPVNITIQKENNNYNTYKIMLQRNNNHTIYYTIDGTIATTNSHKYNHTKIILHNKTVLNILLVDQNNYKHYYNYTTDNELTEYAPINYTIELANYHNITLPQVTRYNNTLDEYIIEEGVNGTVMLPFIRIVNIVLANQTYKFVNGEIEETCNMQLNDYLISFDGQLQTTNHVNPQKKDGILIYTENQTTIIEYHDKTRENINQFTVEYTTRYNHNNNQILLVDCIGFNKNNNYTAMIETNTLPLESITDTFSDLAIRYQLARQYQYTGDITTSTYNQITTNNIPTIKYTRNNKDIFTVDSEPVFDNFIDSPNTIKTSVTINDKTTNRTFTLSHKDYEDILRQNLPHNQLIEELENMTYQYTGAIETYTITNKITTTDDIEEALNTNYTTSIQNTYLASLFVTYFFDSIANEYKNYYNVTYNRTSTITTACYVNASKIIIHSFNPEMGMQIQGEATNKWIYKFTTTSMLNVIEADVINILRNKTGPDKTKSTLEIIFANLAENKDNLITGHRGNNYFIIDSLNNVFISVDLSTGLVNDGSVIDDDLFHASNRECEACLFLKEINENDANWTNNVYGTSLIGGLLLDELHTPEITRYRYMCLYQMTDMFLNRIDKYNLRQFIGPGVIVSILVKQGYNVEYLAQIINYIDEPCEIILSSGMTFAESTVVTFIEACIIGRICHWHTLEDQDKYSPENMKVDEIEKYDYWDGYASISMNYYDYSSVELVKHDFRMENERIMRIKLTTWGKLDKSDIVIVDNTGMHNPTPDEVEYIKDYDNVWDFLWGLPIRNPA